MMGEPTKSSNEDQQIEYKYISAMVEVAIIISWLGNIRLP